LWLLEELRLTYDLRVLAFPPRAHDKSFLELNPRGTVPLLIDGETRMTESAAICEYLALRHSPGVLNVGADEADFGAYLNYLHMSDATLTFPQTLVLRYSRFEPAERLQPQVVNDYSKWFLSRLRTLEPHLATHGFLCADRFTAADVAVGYALMLAELLELHAKFTPAVTAYWQRLRTREGFTRALAAQERAAVAQGVSTRPATEVPPQL
jgi:glutathione S-transferase